MSTKATRALLMLGGLLLMLGHLPRAARGQAGQADGPAYAKVLKEAQRRLLMQEWARIQREHAERNALAKRHRKGTRARVPKETGDPVAPRGLGTGGARTAAPLRASGFPPANVRVNDPAGDLAGDGQAEESVGAFGQYVLIEFNDGKGFEPPGTGDLLGYAYSTDGGVSFTDGGSPPKLSGWRWTSDPVVAVDEASGAFYVTGLIDFDPFMNGIGVVRGTFSGTTLNWETPKLVVSASYFGVGAAAFDKEWLSVDSDNHNVYVSYTKFTATGDHIFFQRSTDLNATWSPAVQMSAGGENGLVQGSRVVPGLPNAVGAPPNKNEVYVAWYSINLTPPFSDFYRIRKSTNGGSTWGGSVIAAQAFHAYENGAPGFNRGNAVDFPSLVVDRTNSAHRGRVYMGWHESINFYDDNLGTLTTKAEIEPNDTPATATPFTMGQTLQGNLTDGARDYWSFSGTQGQTLIADVDSIDSSIDNPFRLYCSDGTTQLALSAPGFSSNGDFGGLIVFTLPSTGIYYLRPASPAGSGGAGHYRIITGWDSPSVGERARDHRDAFVGYSDNGTTWSASPVMVNNDPGYFDNWLPEVAVSGGHAYCIWYDFRDAPVSTCGGVSHTYMARSDDGGGTWNSLGPISDVQTAWTTAVSNIAPNQGDYLGLYGNDTALYPCWADGRDADVNVYFVRLDTLITPTQVSLVSADANPQRVSLTWYAADDLVGATLYRKVADGPWAGLASVTPDGDRMIRYVDSDVVPGERYGYRLGVLEDGAERFFGEVFLDVPQALEFALEGVRPNPAARDFWVSFSLASDAPATLSLLDIAGRKVREVPVGGAGRRLVNLGRGEPLPAGIYIVRLSQGDRALATRVSVVR